MGTGDWSQLVKVAPDFDKEITFSYLFGLSAPTELHGGSLPVFNISPP